MTSKAPSSSPLSGFICPSCVVSLASSEKLQSHWLEFHADDTPGVQDFVTVDRPRATTSTTTASSSGQPAGRPTVAGSSVVATANRGRTDDGPSAASSHGRQQRHQLVKGSLTRPRACKVCHQIIWSDAMSCELCAFHCHVKCVERDASLCSRTSGGLSSPPRKASPSPGPGGETRPPQPQGGRGLVSRVRHKVAQGRARYIDESFDLDLCYITERLIAMSFPSAGVEATYRNNLNDVARMLKLKHKENFMVFNVSERSYDVSKLNHQVLDFGWPDHLAPPLDRLCSICKSIDSWLASDAQNVAVVHCKGGKGRTGVVVAAYMHYSNQHDLSAEAALDLFAMKRFYDDRCGGVTQPSQRRLVKYFENLLKGEITFTKSPIYLSAVLVHGIPNFDGHGYCRPYLRVYQDLKVVYTSDILSVAPGTEADAKKRIVFDFPTPLVLNGDVMIRCFHKRATGHEVVFRAQFHTCAAVRDQLMVLSKPELDDAHADRRFPDNARVELIFQPPPVEIDDPTIAHALSTGQRSLDGTMDRPMDRPRQLTPAGHVNEEAVSLLMADNDRAESEPPPLPKRSPNLVATAPSADEPNHVAMAPSADSIAVQHGAGEDGADAQARLNGFDAIQSAIMGSLSAVDEELAWVEINRVGSFGVAGQIKRPTMPVKLKDSPALQKVNAGYVLVDLKASPGPLRGNGQQCSTSPPGAVAASPPGSAAAAAAATAPLVPETSMTGVDHDPQPRMSDGYAAIRRLPLEPAEMPGLAENHFGQLVSTSRTSHGLAAPSSQPVSKCSSSTDLLAKRSQAASLESLLGPLASSGGGHDDISPAYESLRALVGVDRCRRESAPAVALQRNAITPLPPTMTTTHPSTEEDVGCALQKRGGSLRSSAPDVSHDYADVNAILAAKKRRHSMFPERQSVVVEDDDDDMDILPQPSLPQRPIHFELEHVEDLTDRDDVVPSTHAKKSRSTECLNVAFHDRQLPPLPGGNAAPSTPPRNSDAARVRAASVSSSGGANSPRPQKRAYRLARAAPVSRHPGVLSRSQDLLDCPDLGCLDRPAIQPSLSLDSLVDMGSASSARGSRGSVGFANPGAAAATSSHSDLSPRTSQSNISTATNGGGADDVAGMPGLLGAPAAAGSDSNAPEEKAEKIKRKPSPSGIEMATQQLKKFAAMRGNYRISLGDKFHKRNSTAEDKSPDKRDKNSEKGTPPVERAADKQPADKQPAAGGKSADREPVAKGDKRADAKATAGHPVRSGGALKSTSSADGNMRSGDDSAGTLSRVALPADLKLESTVHSTADKSSGGAQDRFFQDNWQGNQTMSGKNLTATNCRQFWYKKTMSREDADSLLDDRPIGSFLVRESRSTKDAYSLAMRAAPDGLAMIKHYLLEPSMEKPGPGGKPGIHLRLTAEAAFESLEEFVDAHLTEPLALPCKLILPRNDWVEERRQGDRAKKMTSPSWRQRFGSVSGSAASTTTTDKTEKEKGRSASQYLKSPTRIHTRPIKASSSSGASVRNHLPLGSKASDSSEVEYVRLDFADNPGSGAIHGRRTDTLMTPLQLTSPGGSTQPSPRTSPFAPTSSQSTAGSQSSTSVNSAKVESSEQAFAMVYLGSAVVTARNWRSAMVTSYEQVTARKHMKSVHVLLASRPTAVSLTDDFGKTLSFDMNLVLDCSLDPFERRFWISTAGSVVGKEVSPVTNTAAAGGPSRSGMQERPVMGVIVRKSATDQKKVCHLFAPIAENYMATIVVETIQAHMAMFQSMQA